MTTSSPLPTLLFDYGGTLDSAAVHWNFILLEGYHHASLPMVGGEAWRDAYVYGERALAKHPIIAPSDDFHTLLLKKVRMEMHYLVAHRSVDFPLAPGEEYAIGGLADAVYPDCPWPLSPEAEAAAVEIAAYCDAKVKERMAESRVVLEELRCRGYRMVLVTNFYGNIHSVLRAYGIEGFFDAVVESAVVGVRKPDPAIWRMGAEAAGRAPGECIAIGDSFDKDIQAAGAAGCRTVWFKGVEWKTAKRDETLPTHIITALPELLDLEL